MTQYNITMLQHHVNWKGLGSTTLLYEAEVLEYTRKKKLNKLRTIENSVHMTHYRYQVS